MSRSTDLGPLAEHVLRGQVEELPPVQAVVAVLVSHAELQLRHHLLQLRHAPSPAPGLPNKAPGPAVLLPRYQVVWGAKRVGFKFSVGLLPQKP